MDKISYSLAAKAIKGLLTKADIKDSSVLVPSGDTLSRPVLGASEVAIRYNTDTSSTELWDGLAWVSLSADITAVNLKGTDTEANISSITTADNGDLWIASDTLDAWAYDGTNWINIGPLQGPQGVKGDQGTGITSVVRTSGDGSEGTVDTYTITYGDTSTSTFEVRNGTAGTINHIAKTDTVGTTDTYTAYADVAKTQPLGSFEVYNGVDGKGINSVVFTSTTDNSGLAAQSGAVDTYTVTYTDTTTDAFTVYNGLDGDGTVAGLGDLADVDITAAPEDGQGLIFNQGLGLWVPGTVVSEGGVGIVAPTITSPIEGAVDVVLGPTITTSTYTTTDSYTGTQTSGILEIATDAAFGNVVFTDTANTTSFTVSGLPDNTLLYVRAKHISGDFSSLWGPVSTFTTLAITVEQPVVSVSGSPVSITRTPTISGSVFNVIGGTDTHASTSWKVVRTSDAATVWESLLDGVNLTSIQVPYGLLEMGEEYSFECQYHGTQYGASTFGSYTGTVANLFVNKPVLDVQGAPTSVGETPVLSTNTFSTNLESDTHVSTTWIAKQAGSVVWSSVDDTTNLLSITVPSGILVEATEYTFEVYHTGGSFGNSLTDEVTATTATNFSIQYGLVWDDVNDTYARTGAANGWSTGADFTNNETVQSKMKRCVLNSDGTVNYYLNPTNSNLKEDGSASILTGADGNVMVEIPKFWVKYENTTGAKSMSISTAPASGYVLHSAFIKNGVEVDYRYYRAYTGSVSGTKLISRSGVSAAANETIAAFRTKARANGTGWGLVDWYLLFAVQTLLYVEIGTFDSQAVLGNGNDTGSDYGMTTGGSNGVGNGSSPSTNDDTWMSYRGIENFYADIFEFIDGINVSERLVYTSNTQSTFTSDVFTGAYTSAGVTLPSSGYIKNMDFSNNGFIPTVSGGSDATYVPDYVYSNTGARVVHFGGNAGTGLHCGAAYLRASHASSNASANLGAGLSF